jgi:hypothetical protein
MTNAYTSKCILPEEERSIFEKHLTCMNGFYLRGACTVGVLGGSFSLLKDNIVPGHFLQGIKSLCLYV